jgi:hypothetical protein
MKLAIALALLLLAVALAVLVGGFRFALRSLGEPARCAARYLDSRSRRIWHHLPLGVLTLGAVLLMPHWGLAITAAVVVAAALQYGSFRTRRVAVRSMTAYLSRTEGLDPSAARREAERTIRAVVDAKRLGVR